jgi:hypothetical protein
MAVHDTASVLATSCVRPAMAGVEHSQLATSRYGNSDSDASVPSHILWLLCDLDLQSGALALPRVQQILLWNDHDLLRPAWQYLPQLSEVRSSA